MRKWLEKEPSTEQIVGLVILVTVVDLIYNLGSIYVMKLLSVDMHSNKMPGLNLSRTQILGDAFMLFLAAALVEEALFRLPLYVIWRLTSSFKAVWVFIIITAVIFGRLHGDFNHLFLQGMGSVYYCLLFLKCGGLHKKPMQAFLTVVSAHFLFDYCLLALVVVLTHLS